MTAKAKQVKMMRIPQGDFSVPFDADPGDMYSLGSWLIDDAITIIGALVYGVISKGTLSGATENTTLHGEITVGKSASFENNSVILSVIRYLWGDDVTIGIGSHLRNVGVPNFDKQVFFPDGYGIDMEDGDHLYCNIHLHPAGWGGGTGSMAGSVIFFYVER